MKNKALIIVAMLLAAVIAIAVTVYPSLAKKASESLESTTVQSGTEAEISYPEYTDVKIFDKDGNAIKLSDLEGKPIIVNFWATWCGYCLYELPDFEKAYQQYGEEVQFLIVNSSDGITKGEKYITKNGYTFPTYYDLEYSAYLAYRLSSLPRTLAIDADGNMVYNRSGMITAEKLQSIISSILP